MDIVYQKNAEILVFLWASDHVKNGKLFQNVIKVNTFAYAHINIKYFDFSNDFYIFLNWQTYKNSRKMEDFEQNKVHLLKIFLNNLLFFLFPKFLELFFTPKNTSPKVKNSKPDKRLIFLGHPVDNSRFLCMTNAKY